VFFLVTLFCLMFPYLKEITVNLLWLLQMFQDVVTGVSGGVQIPQEGGLKMQDQIK